MLKEDRLNYIVEEVNHYGHVKVTDIINQLHVSDMTIRRDLDELEKRGQLRRVHGGAVSLNDYPNKELSHRDKKIINIDLKKAAARAALPYLKAGETIFLGPGTTMEIFASMMDDMDLRVVTNCLPVFKTLNDKSKQMKLYLVGGEMRKITESFHGSITNVALASINFHKAFVSCNGLTNTDIMTATFEEGNAQKIALNNSNERYLIIDSSKIDKRDFYSYYNLEDITKVFIDHNDSLIRPLEASTSVESGEVNE